MGFCTHKVVTGSNRLYTGLDVIAPRFLSVCSNEMFALVLIGFLQLMLESVICHIRENPG